MKKLITWTVVLVVLVLPLCVAGAMAVDQRAEIDALVVEWRAEYVGSFFWEAPGLDTEIEHDDSFYEMLEQGLIAEYLDNMPPIQLNEIAKEEAIALAIETVCEMRVIEDIGYFKQYFPGIGFTPGRLWVITLLPREECGESLWTFVVRIDAKTGELYDFVQWEPKAPEPWQLTDEPKG